MKTRAKDLIFHTLGVFWLIVACIGTTSRSGIASTPRPFPSETPTMAAIATNAPTTTPAIEAGSFEDFRIFAAEVAAALQGKDISFFDKHATASTWTCLGDETLGVCKGVSSDTTLEGIPVTHDWTTYEVQSLENYKEAWQSTFADHKVVKLIAVAHQFGNNPFMPMATQSSLAIVRVADNSDPASAYEARILFFENIESTWYLRGEMATVANAEAWLNNTCDGCYDTWAAWQE